MIYVIVGTSLLLIPLIIFYMALSKKKTKPDAMYKRKAHKGLISTSTYLTWYNKLCNNPITRSSLLSLYTRLAELSIYDSTSIIVVSMKLYVTSNVIFVFVMLFATLLFKDIFYVLIYILLAVVLKGTFIDKKLDKLHLKMYYQFSEALSSLRQQFMRLGSVPDALLECDVKDLVELPIRTIHEILISSEIETKLEEFYATSPLKVIQTLAGVCYAIHEQGDTRLPGGESSFVNAMSMLSSEVNLEIRRLKLQKSKFGSLEILPLIPLVALAPLKDFFIRTIPSTASVYNGTMGHLTVIFITLLAISAYKVITSVNRVISIKYDDRNDIDYKLLSYRFVRHIVQSIIPTNPKTINKKLKVINSSLSRLNLNYLYLKKLYFCVIALVVSLIVIIASIEYGREYTSSNVYVLSFIEKPIPLPPEEVELLEKMDDFIIEMNFVEAGIPDVIKKYLPGIKESKLEEQIARVITKKKTMDNLYFKFWMLWICLFNAYIAWNVPEIILGFRKWLIKAESEEDTLQLQTIIGIMMFTSIDTLDLLDWLSKHSRVFKPILIDAFHSYPSDDYFALNQLKMRSNIQEFKSMVDKLLLTVSSITLKEAFADIIMEREHLLRMREIAQNTAIDKKRTMMSPVAMSVMMALISLYFIMPIAIVGYAGITEVMKQGF